MFPKCSIDNKSTLIQIMAWCRTSDRPLSKATTLQLADAYMRPSSSMVLAYSNTPKIEHHTMRKLFELLYRPKLTVPIAQILCLWVYRMQGDRFHWSVTSKSTLMTLSFDWSHVWLIWVSVYVWIKTSTNIGPVTIALLQSHMCRDWACLRVSIFCAPVLTR